MQQEDARQFSNLLDQKFKENNKILKEEIRLDFKEEMDQKFAENNKILKEEIVDEIGVIFSQSFNELEAKIDSIDEKLNLVVDKDDKIIKKQQDFETEMAANVGAHDRFEEKFTKTNGRVEVLEKKLGVSQAAV